MTTPIPSLKSDSPAILLSKFFASLAFLTRASTAIGSVGDMSAPKSRQYIKSTGYPINWRV